MLPGTYKATLSANGRDAQTIDVTVKGDPEITITDSDRRMWFDTARELHQLQEKANDVAEMVQNAFAQVQTLAAADAQREPVSVTPSSSSMRW